MKARPVKREPRNRRTGIPPRQRANCKYGIDLDLLEDSLAKTVWERMLANDDALRLADLLQAAMLKTRAKS